MVLSLKTTDGEVGGFDDNTDLKNAINLSNGRRWWQFSEIADQSRTAAARWKTSCFYSEAWLVNEKVCVIQ